MAATVGADRNRAVDLYRAIAMLAVAFGHWLVMVAYYDTSGAEVRLITGNALEFVAGFHLATWLFQVMPLFFLVGGFASAASLDSKAMGRSSTAGQKANWIAARLARLLPPVGVLAGFWLVAIAVGYATGTSAPVNAAAAAAAIPLWFLANYTADIVLAPHVLPRFRRSPRLTAGLGLGLFAGLEGLRLAAEAGLITGPIRHLPHINWILGWFLFQMAGFAWRDGLLPTGRRLVVWAAGLWAVAVMAVTVGPWPVSMVNFPGLGHSPTHPPTLGLLVFGAAQGATAIWLAPRVTAWLAADARAWTAVVGANGLAMTVYLWHMTAAVAVLAVFDQFALIGDDAPGTAGWWLAKIPFVIAAVGTMAVIVPRLGGIERAALLSPKADWAGSPWLLLAGAVVLSTALKAWTGGQITVVVPALVVVVTADRFLTRAVGAGSR